ncbi:unnamed protein product [Heterobilharzia americana]|nr:unnamed protein product [Heterobilharzia americana]
MNSLLTDESKSQKLVAYGDTTEKTEKHLTEPLKKIKQQGFISESTFEMLKPTGTVTRRLYGLPKLHRISLPLRPTLDMTKMVGTTLETSPQRSCEVQSQRYLLIC